MNSYDAKSEMIVRVIFLILAVVVIMGSCFLFWREITRARSANKIGLVMYWILYYGYLCLMFSVH